MTIPQESVRPDSLVDPHLAMLRVDYALARERERIARHEVHTARRLLRALRLDAPSQHLADATSRYHDALTRYEEAVEDIARLRRERHTYQREVNARSYANS